MMNRRTAIFGIAGVAVALLASAATGQAQEFPSKPIQVIVPFKPGGYTDSVARVIAKAIEDNDLLSQPLVIVNMGGGGGAAAYEKMISSPKDGETIMLWQYNALISKALGVGNFDIDDIVTLGYTGTTSPVWAVGPKSGLTSFEDIVTQLKAEPKSLVEVGGIGTIAQFAGTKLEQEAGIETRFVNGNSGADRQRMLMGGNADISLFSPSEVLGNDQITPVASFAPERSDKLPDVPTVTELGYPDATWSNAMWWMAPKGIPEDVQKTLSTALEKAVNTPEVQEFFTNNGDDPSFTPGPEATEEARERLKSIEATAAKMQ